MKFLIMPYNEGQELNYSEIQSFPSKRHAKIYAREMARKLSIVMPQGMITIEVEDL